MARFTHLAACTALVSTLALAAPASAHNPDDYFQNFVLDDEPTELFPDPSYEDGKTDDTARVQAAVDAAAAEDENGGVVILRKAPELGNSTYRIGTVYMPSNIRVEVDPEVTLVQNANPEPRPGHEPPAVVGTFDRNKYMFATGVTPTYYPNGRKRPPATGPKIENVEIRSTVPGQRFTVDLKREYPVEYWFRPSTFTRPETPTEIREDGQNEVFASPFVFGWSHNVRVSDVDVIDNFTVLPAVHIYPDANGQFGSLRFSDPRPKSEQGTPYRDANGNILKDGDLINEAGNKLGDDEEVVRNLTWGRTTSKGTFENITTLDSHTGYGLLQVYGGEWIYMRDLHGEGGITVRLEPGSGTDRMNAAGPMPSRIANIEIENISNRNGFTTLWMNPHGKYNENIKARDIRAYDSGSALLILKSTINDNRRDYVRGYFKNVELSGEVLLEKTHEEPTAEIGYYSTYFIHPDLRAAVVDRTGNADDGHATLKPDGVVAPHDMPNPVPGRRWFLTEAIVPIMAMNQLSADNVGRVDTDRDGTPDMETDREDFYPIDFSNVTIVRRGPLRNEQDIVYRSDMVDFTSGQPAWRFISE